MIDKQPRNFPIGEYLINLQRGFMFISAIFVVGIMCLIVFLRYILKVDLFGMEEIIVMVGIWMYFIGSAFASYKNRQITADVLLESLKKEKHKRILRIITSSITLVVCLLFNFWAFKFFLWGIVKNPHSPIYSIPLVIPQSAVFIGFSLMSIFSALNFINEIAFYRYTKN